MMERVQSLGCKGSLLFLQYRKFEQRN